MQLEEYARLFREGRTTEEQIEGLCGRILKGRNPRDFKTLSHNPNRKIVMLMDGHGLRRLISKSGYEALSTIGYRLNYIKYMVKNAYQFKLIVTNRLDMIKPATWDAAIELITHIYPDVMFKALKHLQALKETPFAQLQNLCSFNLDEVDNNGPSDPNYMTYERFKKCKGTLVDVRVLMYHTIKLRALFSGDGYTYTPTGKRGVIEYFLAPNMTLDDLGEYILLDMKVELPLEAT